jgi:hypothetical protein
VRLHLVKHLVMHHLQLQKLQPLQQQILLLHQKLQQRPKWRHQILLT